MANAVVKKSARGASQNDAVESRAATVLYVYGLSPAKAHKLEVTAPGVDGAAPIEALGCAGFVAWVSRVDSVEFGERLADNMENLEWLATAGVRHQQAVSAISAKAEILPARFGTVFTGEESLEADLKSRKKEIMAAFERVAAADEWGVKVFVERAPQSKPTVQAQSGSEYLKRKAASLESRAKRAAMDDQVKEFATAMNKLAVASVEGGKVSGGQPNLQWQASVLVRRAKRRQFENLLKRYASKWSDEKRIECSGPWPPYSFVTEHGR